MKASELIYRCLTTLREGKITDDESWSEEIILNMANSYRSRLLKQDKDNGRYMQGYLVQTLGEVELINADKNECSIVAECIRRTKNPIPKALSINSGDMLTFVGSTDGDRYERVNSNTYKVMQFSKWTGKKPKFFERGNYLYILNPPSPALKYIAIEGIFEEPQLANSFKTCGNMIDCFNNLDFEYPVSNTIADAICKMITDEIKRGFFEPRDITNNSQDDPIK